MFESASSFNQDISAWVVQKSVTNMAWMFKKASAFNQDISEWDTSGVTTMKDMFGYASSFNQDISEWRIDSVTNMRRMFNQASAFDQDLGWCLDRGVDTWKMFEGAACTLRSCNVRVRPPLAPGGGCALV